MPAGSEEKIVIIIGAGASGIGAARTFMQAGINPIILEARDRIGGRMCATVMTKNLLPRSKRTPEKVTVQLGANWIHCLDDSNPFYVVAKKLGLNLHMTSSDDEPGDDVVLFDAGADSNAPADPNGVTPYFRINQTEYEEALRRYEWIRDHFEELFSKQMQMKECFEKILKASEEFFGPCSDTHRRCFNWFFDRVSIDLASPLESAATDSYLEVETTGLHGEALVEGGYFQVLDHLASEYPLDIRLNHVVHTIKYLERKGVPIVRVVCNNGQIFDADACLVTLPVGVIQANDVSFVPAVPKQISALCSEVKAGLMNIVWLWYPTMFWPENCNFLGVAHNGSALVEFGTFLAPPIKDQFGKRQPVLMCQVIGKFAEAIEFMTEDEVAEQATNVLRAMFGAGAVPDAVGCLRSNWKNDRFSRGSWTHIPYKTLARVSSFVVGNDKEEAIGAAVAAAMELADMKLSEFDISMHTSYNTTGVHTPAVHRSDTVDDSSSDSEAGGLSDHESSTRSITVIEEEDKLRQMLPPAFSPFAKNGPGKTSLKRKLTIDDFVFYSGEASNPENRGTAHSAYQSGIEEALKMIFHLSLATR